MMCIVALGRIRHESLGGQMSFDRFKNEAQNVSRPIRLGDDSVIVDAFAIIDN